MDDLTMPRTTGMPALARKRRRRLLPVMFLYLVGSGMVFAQVPESGAQAPRPAPDQKPSVEAVPAEEPAPAMSALSGQLRLIDEDGHSIAGEVDLRESVVYFNPARPVAVEPQDDEVLLTTARRQFVPRVVVVEAGSVVRFPNEDPILHNVFSSSPGNRFDLGLYSRSEGLTHRFDEPGLVRVFCNVHSRMSAHIVVVDTPFHVRPDGEGRFRFDALPTGPGTLTAWHERSDPLQIAVEIGPSDRTLAPIELQATVRQIAPQRQRLRRRRRY